MNRAKNLLTMDKTYQVKLTLILFTISDLEQRAIAVLNGRRRASRPSTEPAKSIPELSRMPSLDGGSDLKGTPSILGMKHWLDELGHSVLAGPFLVYADANSSRPPALIT